MKKPFIALAAAAMVLSAAPAAADSPNWGASHSQRDRHDDRHHDRYDRHHDRYDRSDRHDRHDDRYDRRDRREYRQNVYDNRGRYAEPRRVNRNDKVWRGRDGQYYCERDNGTTGLIIGAAGGALLGREIDGGRERTLGTILGAAVGGLLGREIDRGDARCR